MNKTGQDVEIGEYLDYVEEKGLPTKEEEGKTYVEVGGRIYEVKIEEGELKVEYIEKGEITEPRITKIEVLEKTLDSIKIKVESVRLDNGTYTYYIGTSTDNLEEKGSNKTGEYTFTELSGGKYYIKVVGEREDGKTAEKTIEVKLESIPMGEGSIEYAISWNNGTATVVLRTESEYTIEHSLDNKNYTEGTIVTGLKDGDIVYARLTNGEYSGEAIQIKVEDEAKPTVEITAGKVSTKSIEITAKGIDQESGINLTKGYTYYISNINGEIENSAGSNNTGVFSFQDLDQNTEYTIKVEVEDNAGNKGEGSVRINTGKIPSAEEGIKRESTWNEDGTVKINLSTETEFDILYSRDRKQWLDYLETGIDTVNGSGIYICLTDGRNKGEDYFVEVKDEEGPQVTVERGVVTANSIAVNVKAIDNISGMPENAQYNYYIKTSEEGEYRLIGENQPSATYVYRDLKAQTTYNIKVTTKEIVGNEGEGT